MKKFLKQLNVKITCCHTTTRERVAFKVEYSARVAFETAFMGCLMYMYVCRRGLRHFACIRLPSANKGRVFAIPHSSINTSKHRTAFQSYNINVI